VNKATNGLVLRAFLLTSHSLLHCMELHVIRAALNFTSPHVLPLQSASE